MKSTWLDEFGNAKRTKLLNKVKKKTQTLNISIFLRCIIFYLSHALKNTANQRPGLPLHILQCATGNMQRVVLHSTFPSLLARNSLLGSHLKSQLRNSSTPANHYEHFRSCITTGNFPKISKHFRWFPKILKNHKNIWKLVLNRLRSFPKISEDFQRFSKDFKKSLKTSGKYIWAVSEVFQKFHK